MMTFLADVLKMTSQPVRASSHGPARTDRVRTVQVLYNVDYIIPMSVLPHFPYNITPLRIALNITPRYVLRCMTFELISWSDLNSKCNHKYCDITVITLYCMTYYGYIDVTL